MEWYDWRNVCESLVTFGRAIQGVSPYTVVIEPDERSARQGTATSRSDVSPSIRSCSLSARRKSSTA